MAEVERVSAITRYQRFRGEVAAGRALAAKGQLGPDLQVRYFEAATTDRLSEAHWAYAADDGVNAWLIRHLHVVRARAQYEVRNNPMMAGAVRSFVLGVVGEHAPSLQVQSDAKAFNEAVERYWRERRDDLDTNGVLSFYDLICQAVGSLPTCGEALAQIVTGADSLTRVLTQEPRRLESLIAFRHGIDGTHTVLGIKRTATGKPLEYSFRGWDDATGAGSFRYIAVPAAQVIHYFEPDHPGQARGIPLLASALPTGAELRDFDAATLRAARTAAEHTVLLEPTGPDVEYQAVDDEIDIESGTMATLPPGYTARQLTPEHPANGYVEFRHERLREIGRPLSMPLMMVLLDSSKMNYSSARFDGQMFQRATASTRTRLERCYVSRLLRLIVLEGQALGRIPPSPPAWTPRWGWQPMPHVDPMKEAEAAGERVRIGISTLTDETAAGGRDYIEDIVPQLAKERDARKAAGLHEPGAETPPEGEDEESSDGESEQAGADERGASDGAWTRAFLDAVAIR